MRLKVCCWRLDALISASSCFLVGWVKWISQTSCKSTAWALISYLTYQAVRTVLKPVNETNPPLAFWLHGFSQLTEFRMEALHSNLFKTGCSAADHDCQLPEVDFLPEMDSHWIQQANMEHAAASERITAGSIELQPDTS